MILGEEDWQAIKKVLKRSYYEYGDEVALYLWEKINDMEEEERCKKKYAL